MKICTKNNLTYNEGCKKAPRSNRDREKLEMNANAVLLSSRDLNPILIV